MPLHASHSVADFSLDSGREARYTLPVFMGRHKCSVNKAFVSTAKIIARRYFFSTERVFTEERLRNDLFGVEKDIKPCSVHSMDTRP